MFSVAFFGIVRVAVHHELIGTDLNCECRPLVLQLPILWIQ